MADWNLRRETLVLAQTLFGAYVNDNDAYIKCLHELIVENDRNRETGVETSHSDPSRTRRILVTGSRDWADADTIQTALYNAWTELFEEGGRKIVLVQGECEYGGADKIAADIWRTWGLPVEGHPAERGEDGRILGPERNAKMVNLGADVCLAFPLPSSRGTRNCMRLAREAGIPVRVFAPKEQS